MALAGEEECANTCFVKHGARWHTACWHSAFGRGNVHFHGTLRNKSAAGGAVSAGEGPGRGSATVPEEQSSPMVVLRHAARNRDRGAPSATGLKHVAAPGPVCSRLCVPGKSTCTEHPVREPSSAVRRLAGRLLRAAAHLSPFLSEFLKEALWWGQSLWRGCFSGSRDVPVCPGLFALQPKGQLSRKIAQTTHLRLASLRLVPQSFLIVSTNQR